MAKQSTTKNSSNPPSTPEQGNKSTTNNLDASAVKGGERGQAAQQPKQQMGEGSYEATRDYQKNIGDYMKNADIDADAKAAKPRSEQEARELKKAEEEGLSHAKDSQNAPRK